MYNTDFVTVQHLHQTRMRAARRSELDERLATREQTPMLSQTDLLRDVRQWMQRRHQEEVSDVRRAHAV